MKVIWRGCGCEAIFLLISLILSSAPAPTATQVQRRTFCVNQTQVEQVLKRFQTGGSREEQLKKILECLERGECSGGTEEYLVNEILLRLQMRERGEECTSVGKYSKPFYETFVQSSPDREYITFQDELLDTGLTFCNPFKHLYCSPQKKCECRPGTTLKPEVNPEVCTLIPGGYCLDPGSSEFRPHLPPALYDPFNSKFPSEGRMEFPQLQCLEGEGCRSLDYFHPKICPNDAIVELDKKLVDHFKDLPRLSFGDSCNLEHHEELLKSPETEWADYTIRVKKLEQIMGAKIQFCDNRRLLVCGNSGKCECISPAFYDEKTKNCTYTNTVVLCSQTRIMDAFVAALTGAVGRDVKTAYDSAKYGVCKGGCSPVQGQNLILCRVCRNDSVIGRNCNKIRTSFLKHASHYALPIDEPHYGKQLDLLDEISDKATELENILRLDEGSPCDLEAELEAGRAIRRIRNLESDWISTLPVPVTTKGYYRETIRFTDTVIGQNRVRGLCKYVERLVSGPSGFTEPRSELICGLNGPNATNTICYAEKNNDAYLEILRKRLIPFETLREGDPCTLDVKKLFVIARGRIPEEGEFPFGILFGLLASVFDYYQFLIVTLETHFDNKTQFCNSNASLECKVPNVGFVTQIGKCVSTEEMKKGKGNEKETNNGMNGGTKHLIHIFIFVILFTLYSILIYLNYPNTLPLHL